MSWNEAFLGVIALATMIMALIQIGAVIAAARIAKQAQQALTTVQQDIRPLIAKVNAVADEASRTATLATAQSQKFDRLVTDLSQRVEETTAIVQQAIIMPAHRELEKLVCTIHQNNLKGTLESHWAFLCYAGLWLEPLRADLDAYMDSVNEVVTGEITIKLYRGSATPVARSSPYALYDRNLASFGESGGDFSQHASPGFIELFTLQSRLAHRVRESTEREEEKP